jgi:hypothetical protein
MESLPQHPTLLNKFQLLSGRYSTELFFAHNESFKMLVCSQEEMFIRDSSQMAKVISQFAPIE